MARKSSGVGAIELMISIIADLKSAIFNSRYLWSNEKYRETGVGHSNLQVVTTKHDRKYKKCIFKLVDEPKY